MKSATARWLICSVLVLLTVAVFSQNSRSDNMERYGRPDVGPNVLQEIEEEHRISLDVVTPHTVWAKPYARGTVRVLIFCSAWRFDTMPREPAELLQRFDVAVDVAYGEFVRTPEPFDRWHGGAAGEARIMRLMERPYDVYLFLHLSPQNLPPAARVKLAAAVAGGAGLVLVGTDDNPESRRRHPDLKPATGPDDDPDLEPARETVQLLKRQHALPELPALLTGYANATAYAINDGRAVTVPPRPVIAYRRGWEAEYDYWEESLWRALLWAANREPQAVLSITPPPTAWTAADAPVTVAWRGAPARGCTLEARVRLEDGRKIPLATRPIDGAEGRATFTLPSLPAGAHHLEAVLRDGPAAVSWAVHPFSINTSRRVQLTLTQSWGEIGETVSGQVSRSGAVLPNERLSVQLVDAQERVIQRQVMATDGTFRFPIAEWFPMLLRVEAVLTSDNHAVDAPYAYYNVTQRRQGQFNFVVWCKTSGTANYSATDAVARLGANVVICSGNPKLETAACTLPWIPNIPNILNVLNTEGVTRTGCWNDPKIIAQREKELAATYQPGRQHGMFAYSLGDEGVTHGACLHPACLTAYRAFLQRSYGTIAALNAAWGTTYPTFDEVALSDPTDGKGPVPDLHDDPETVPILPVAEINEERLALRAGNYPRWYDRVAFGRENLLQYCRSSAEAFRKNDPQALVGFEGSSGGEFGLGADVERLVNTLQFWVPYKAHVDELIRSIAPRSFIRGNWTGYAYNADDLLFDYWRSFTRGADSMCWWMDTGMGTNHGLIAADFAPYAATREMLDDTRITRDGLGDLLLQCPRLDDGIAILYSQPSECASVLGVGATFGTQVHQGDKATITGMDFWNYTADLANWHQAIWDAGLQFTYVTDRMIEKAPLDPKRYKVLILPCAEALSDKAAQAIRAFVEAGGTIIADVRPGIYTDHCQPRQTGCLNELFGIARTDDVQAVRGDLKIAGVVNGHPLSLVFSVKDAQALGGVPNARALGGYEYGPRIDPAVTITTGTAYGKAGNAPLCVVHAVGKGKAVLLNFALTGCYMPVDLWHPEKYLPTLTPEPLAIFIGNLLATAGVTPQVRLTDAAGHPVRNAEIIRWQNGNQQIITVFRKYGETSPVRVTLPQAGELYDLRTGKALGNRATIDTELRANRPRWFAILPKPMPTIRVTLDAPQVVAGQVIHATVSVPNATGLHALCLRLSGPDTPDARWIRRIVVTDEVPIQMPIPMALNDPAGTWMLEATDLLGGQAKVDFRLVSNTDAASK